MGNQPSLPEQVLTAVQKNDVCGFQALVKDFGTVGLSDPDARARILEHKDRNGRTPLLVAAHKNHFQILQQLIRLGADVRYINPARDMPGGALHEAAARRHEAAVELLLASGANPFAANASGRTALEEAVLAGHTGVVRAIEKHADFTGRVAFKTRTLAGMSSKHKARWAVLMPYYPYPGAPACGLSNPPSVASSAPSSAGGASSVTGANVAAAGLTGGPGSRGGSHGGAPKVRRCLWLYKDASSNSPRCRLWVDGVAVLTHGPAGTEATLRLHTSHAEPVGDVYTSYERGYCVYMRPADLTPPAAEEYHQLVALLAAPYHQGPYVPRGGGGSSGGGAVVQRVPAAPLPPANGRPSPAPPPPPPPPVVQLPPGGGGGGALSPASGSLMYPAVQQIAVFGGAGAQPPPAYPYPYPYPSPGPQPSTPSYTPQGTPPPITPPSPPSAPVLLASASPLTHHLAAARAAGQLPPQPPQRSASQRGVGQGQGSPATPPPAREASGGQLVGSAGRVIGERFIEHMAALPGETDEDFAARLASAISATSGHSQQILYPDTAGAPDAPSGHQRSNSATPTMSAAALRPGQQPGGARTSTPPGGRSAASVSGALPPRAPAPSGGLLPPSLDSLIAGRPAGHPAGPHGPGATHGSAPHAAPTRGPADQLDMLDMDAVVALATQSSGGAGHAHGGGGGGPSAGGPGPSGPAGPPQQPAAPGGGYPRTRCQEEAEAPSAPPADAVLAGAGGRAAPEPESDEALCIICLSAPKEVGYLHGDTVHRCVCKGCSEAIRVGAPCPLCRRPIERVLGVY